MLRSQLKFWQRSEALMWKNSGEKEEVLEKTKAKEKEGNDKVSG